MTTATQSIAVIINPISGTGGRPEVARQRAERAARLIDARGLDAQVFVTERPGHGYELARAAASRGASTVVAWGGDGTVNEVASALAFGPSALAIVPGGSGNGLARELGIPFDPDAAINVAIAGESRAMDAGELDGHLFFNVAGIGLDAHIARRFAANGLKRRGFARYVELALREMATFESHEHTIAIDGEPRRTRLLLLAIANSRQYGNGAIIAPQARIDDGRFDAVIVEDRSRMRALLQAPRMFTGQVARVPGVTIHVGVNIVIESARPIVFHVDGEPHVAGTSVAATMHPLALRVRIPQTSRDARLRADT